MIIIGGAVTGKLTAGPGVRGLKGGRWPDKRGGTDPVGRAIMKLGRNSAMSFWDKRQLEEIWGLRAVDTFTKQFRKGDWPERVCGEIKKFTHSKVRSLNLKWKKYISWIPIMSQDSMDPMRQQLIYQMSQNLIRLQLESNRQNLLSPVTPLSPVFCHWQSPTSPLLLPWQSPSSSLPSTSGLPTPPSLQKSPKEDKGYMRWWERDDKDRASSGGDSGRGTSESPSSIHGDEADIDNEEVFKENKVKQREFREVPAKKRRHFLPPLSAIQNSSISSTCENRETPPRTLPAPLTHPITPLNIPSTPLSLPASPWNLLFQRHPRWNPGPFSPLTTPTSPQFFKFPPPSFMTPEEPPHSKKRHVLHHKSTSPSEHPRVILDTPEWLDSLRTKLGVLPSDSIRYMTDLERNTRIKAMRLLSDSQMTNIKKYLEKRTYSVRDDLVKEDFCSKPIILKAEFVSSNPQSWTTRPLKKAQNIKPGV